MTAPIFIVVLHFTVGGISAAVLPREHRGGYLDKTVCVKSIPAIKRQWSALLLPMPDKITCEKIEVK